MTVRSIILEYISMSTIALNKKSNTNKYFCDVKLRNRKLGVFFKKLFKCDI